MPRYVILEHDHPILHWDFMLETGPILRTWRLATAPAPGQVISALFLSDHRLVYLDYEGPLSGGRGKVSRWDSGIFDWLSHQESDVAVHLHGERLQGAATLRQIKGDDWTFVLTEGQ
jgi:hypothetical protein